MSQYNTRDTPIKWHATISFATRMLAQMAAQMAAQTAAQMAA